MLVAARPSAEGGASGVAEAAETMRRLALAGERQQKRRSQALAWAQASFEARFGAEGWRAASASIIAAEGVFSANAAAAARLSTHLASYPAA